MISIIFQYFFKRALAFPAKLLHNIDGNERERPMTIADIAREAGVSQATVSRVLNGHDSVVPEKREAVLRIVRETGFKQRAMVPKSAEIGRASCRERV